jgi:DhnA family fructose-bisphosphate aldolase class Ia
MGRALNVALDHGLFVGRRLVWKNLDEVILKIVEGGADAVLTSYGISIRFAKELARVGLILRADGSGTKMSGYQSANSIFFDGSRPSIPERTRWQNSAFPGGENEVESHEILAQTVGWHTAWSSCAGRNGPGGFDSPPEKRTTEAIALSARVGAELGADFYQNSLRAEFLSAFQRALLYPGGDTGGAKRGKEVDMLRDIKAAVDAGANGCCDWPEHLQAEDPTAMTRAISAILQKALP